MSTQAPVCVCVCVCVCQHLCYNDGICILYLFQNNNILNCLLNFTRITNSSSKKHTQRVQDDSKWKNFNNDI